jgi:hypothetical protein
VFAKCVCVCVCVCMYVKVLQFHRMPITTKPFKQFEDPGGGVRYSNSTTSMAIK